MPAKPPSWKPRWRPNARAASTTDIFSHSLCLSMRSRSERPQTLQGMRIEANWIAAVLKRNDFKLNLHHLLRHCEPPGRREAPPDDRLREAIQGHKIRSGLLRRYRS